MKFQYFLSLGHLTIYSMQYRLFWIFSQKSFCLLRYLDFSCQMSCHTIRCWLAHIWQKWASIIYTYNKCHTGKMFCLYYCLVIMYYCKHYKRGPFLAPLCTCTPSKQPQNLTPRSSSIFFIFLQFVHLHSIEWKNC